MKNIAINEFLNNTLDTWSWDPIGGTSWYYYINTGDYKIEQREGELVIFVLAAGLQNEDIRAHIENGELHVDSTKPGWNGPLHVVLNLMFYKINIESPQAELRNGVLKVSFPTKDEKKKLEIK